MGDHKIAMDAAIAFSRHDHADCAGEILARTDALCAERGLRMTPVRRRVMEILLETHKALGAYEVLDRLAQDGFGNQPPVAYRALDFLVEQGFAHRIRRLNAFAACMRPGHSHSPCFFICRECQGVAEAPADSIRGAVDKASRDLGFVAERVNIEVAGLCPSCVGAAQ